VLDIFLLAITMLSILNACCLITSEALVNLQFRQLIVIHALVDWMASSRF
jgi:hypothetical protein